MPNSRWALGVDMGGTFIDVVACAADGRLHSLKHPREQGSLAAALLDAIDRMCAAHGIAAQDVARIVHGSTVVTNLLLEQNAAPVAVLTNRGMRDVLALGRQDRRELYAPVIARPTPEDRLFPAHLRFEFDGRIDAQGVETAALCTDGLDDIAQAIERAGVRAAAVCLLFSHANPRHELQLRALLQSRLPGLLVSLSSEVDPKPREFERFLTTALDAYSKPLVSDYLHELAQALRARGLPEPFLMRSEGGTGAWRDVAQRPVSLAMSGPCAALQGIADGLAGAAPQPAVVMTLDVGGTSTDIGLIEHGRPSFAEALECAGLPLRMRCADIESLPLGGGSVVRVLAGRALRLGPHSQGARPGPAAHGLGGTCATLTDALCVLGRLPPRLAGGIALDRAAAAAAIARDVAAPLGTAVQDAAAAVVRTAASAMAEALKMRSFQRGLDPADTLLVAAGGGGGQHAAEVAELAGIGRVRVLPHAGVVAALGMLCAPPTQTIERACDLALAPDGVHRLREIARAAVPAAPCALTRWSLALCPPGQESPIEVSWDPDADDAESLLRRYAQRHAQLRGEATPGQAVHARLLRAVFEQAVPAPAPVFGSRAAAAPDGAWGDLPPRGDGPRALFAALTTVWVPAGWHWTRLDDDSLALQARGAGASDHG